MQALRSRSTVRSLPGRNTFRTINQNATFFFPSPVWLFTQRHLSWTFPFITFQGFVFRTEVPHTLLKTLSLSTVISQSFSLLLTTKTLDIRPNKAEIIATKFIVTKSFSGTLRHATFTTEMRYLIMHCVKCPDTKVF